jgi:GntR family transcriptional regulator
VISLRLDPKSGVPPYLQVAQQVRQALVAGVLVPGDQLPTVKEVVTRLAINPNTVFKGYRELEREGLVEGRPGAGTFVLRRPPGPAPGTHASLARSLTRWVARARAGGLDDASIESLLRETLHAQGIEEIA